MASASDGIAYWYLNSGVYRPLLQALGDAAAGETGGFKRRTDTMASQLPARQFLNLYYNRRTDVYEATIDDSMVLVRLLDERFIDVIEINRGVSSFGEKIPAHMETNNSQ